MSPVQSPVSTNNEIDDFETRQSEMSNYQREKIELDYVDHRLVNDENTNDGQGFIYNEIIAPFRVEATRGRRGRSKGAAAQFGFFAHRGGVQGKTIPRSKSVNTNKSTTRATTSRATIKRATTGLGSRGPYKKKAKIHEPHVVDTSTSPIQG